MQYQEEVKKERAERDQEFLQKKALEWQRRKEEAENWQYQQEISKRIAERRKQAAEKRETTEKRKRKQASPKEEKKVKKRKLEDSLVDGAAPVPEKLSTLTVVQLKDRLRDLNLTVGGRKHELICRLNEAARVVPKKAKAVDTSLEALLGI